MRFNSSAQAAAAVVQNDGYKPREERSWEEFHPDLDIDAKLQLFSASDVDALPPAVPETPAAPLSANGSINGVHGALTPTSTRALTPNGTANATYEEKTRQAAARPCGILCCTSSIQFTSFDQQWNDTCNRKNSASSKL
jgi:hypothetical protein